MAIDEDRSGSGIWYVTGDESDQFYWTFPTRAEYVELLGGNDRIIGSVNRVGNSQPDLKWWEKPNPLYKRYDTLDGGNGDDVLFMEDIGGLVLGGNGDDQIISTSHAQTDDQYLELYGDDDAYEDTSEHGNDIISPGVPLEYIDGGGGRDTLTYAVAIAAVFVDLTARGPKQGIGYGGGVGENPGMGTYDIIIRIEDIIGSRYDDRLAADGFANAMWGGDGHDTLLGLGANDTLRGENGNDSIEGGDGYDTLYGGEGFDILRGQNGRDWISGGDGNDSLFGGEANDILRGDAGQDTIIGGDGADTIHGGDNNDTIEGNLGHDCITGGTGRDLIYAGDGNDTVSGGDADDTIFGGRDNDSLLGNDGRDSILGGDGNDDIAGGNGRDDLEGGDGSDRINGGAHGDTIHGGRGNDLLAGSDGDDEVRGAKGNDIVYGNGDDDSLFGGEGNDDIGGGSGDDTINPGVGSDIADGGFGTDLLDFSTSPFTVFINLENGFANANTAGGGVETNLVSNFENATGSAHDDYIIGTSFENELKGLSGKDQIAGLEGNDRIFGDDGADILFGNEGHDRIEGGRHVDFLFGGHGADELIGGRGDDFIEGGGGDDYMEGNSGADVFYFAAAEDYEAEESELLFTGSDRVQDFNIMADQIDLTGLEDIESAQVVRLDDNSVRIDFLDTSSGHSREIGNVVVIGTGVPDVLTLSNYYSSAQDALVRANSGVAIFGLTDNPNFEIA